MKISVQQHKRYLATTFSKSERSKIEDWIDERWREFQEKNAESSASPDMLTWRWLLETFIDIPDGKLTKAFMYQMLVLNDVVNDGTNRKSECPVRRTCKIVDAMLEKLDRSWQDSDFQNICSNMGICLRTPDPDLYPFSLEMPSGIKEFVIDDRILSMKR